MKMIVEENWSTKTVKKELSGGRNMMVKIRNQERIMVYDREGICEVTTKFYENLYSRSKEIKIRQERKSMKENWLKIIRGEVENAIVEVKNNKAGGPDRIDNETIKTFKDILVPHLTRTFNEVVEEEWIPKQWEVGEIILIYKKGVKEGINNYRPICLTSNVW